MKNQAVQYQGKTYRYIPSLLDVFSRIHWLCPFQTKHSHGIKENIKKIFAVHGMPEMPQSDKEKEFKGSNENDLNGPILTIQSEGARKWSHRVLRNKISFDRVT